MGNFLLYVFFYCLAFVFVYIWQLAQRKNFEKAFRIEQLMTQWQTAVAKYKYDQLVQK